MSFLKNAALGITVAAQLSGAAGLALADGMADRLDAVIDQALVDKRLVGAVLLVAREGELVYARAAGLRDRESGVAMEKDTIFRLASITKPMVTAAAMGLIEEGQLDLDDPVTKWLPDFTPKAPDGSTPVILIRQLLNHTSGLSYALIEEPDGPYRVANVSDGMDQPGLSMQENLDRIVSAPLAYKPGEGWRYSLAIDVLGAVLQEVTGKPLDQVVRDKVTGPLAMTDTDFTLPEGTRDRLSAAYANSDAGPLRMEGHTVVPFYGKDVAFDTERVFDPASYPSGGAGMVGTAGDFLTFLEAVRTGGGPILSSETIQMMMTDHAGPQAQTQGPGWGFGYGWAVLSAPEQAETPQSPGTIQWGGAYGHNWFVDPAEQLTVVLFTNTTFEGMAGQVTSDVRDAVYAD